MAAEADATKAEEQATEAENTAPGTAGAIAARAAATDARAAAIAAKAAHDAITDGMSKAEARREGDGRRPLRRPSRPSPSIMTAKDENDRIQTSGFHRR